ncbi:hypothetical protein SDC9_194865 [bioreactor metagenome]|uniref:Uncharacterized protein n=1 Tax=bioreactor metagenome TaxID=1076179 RepID=A0A645IIU1_9ZZZZ
MVSLAIVFGQHPDVREYEDHKRNRKKHCIFCCCAYNQGYGYDPHKKQRQFVRSVASLHKLHDFFLEFSHGIQPHFHLIAMMI